jgi:hypothetical protein
MSYQTVLWILFGALLITFLIVRKKKNKRLNTTLWSLVILVFIGQTFLPRQLFGEWNSISKFDDKKIIKILLQPSEPNWKINLVGKNFIISDNNQIDTLTSLLKKVEVYFPGHPSRIWETKMIIVSSDKDSFEIEINKTSNNGSVIYTKTNEWRKDEIGNYLEKITNYSKPIYSDTSTTKF